MTIKPLCIAITKHGSRCSKTAQCQGYCRIHYSIIEGEEMLVDKNLSGKPSSLSTYYVTPEDLANDEPLPDSYLVNKMAAVNLGKRKLVKRKS